MKYFEEWKNSWLDLFQNLKLIIPDILFLILSGLIAFLILQISGLFPIVKTVYVDKDFSVITNSLVRVIVSVLIFGVTTFVLGAGIRAVKFNFIKDVVKNKKVDLSKFFEYSNRDVWRVICVRILLFLIFFGLLIGVGLISGLLSLVLTRDVVILIGVGILGLISVIYAFSVMFVYPVMFLKGKKALDSVKLSFDYFRKNVKHVIFVWFIITLTGVGISYVVRLFSFAPLVISLNLVLGLFVGVWGLIYLFRAL